MAINNFNAKIQALIDQSQIDNELKTKVTKASQKTTANITVRVDGQQLKDASREMTTFKTATGQTYKEMKTFNSAGEQVGKTVTTMTEKFNKGTNVIGNFANTLTKVAKFAVATAVLGTITSAISSGVEAVKELDSALTELSKVSDLSSEGLKRYAQQAAEVGESVSKTATQVVEAATEFVKSGYNEEQAMQLAKTALMYQNIADAEISAGDAAGFIISQLRAFNMTSMESMHVVDALNEVKIRVASLYSNI